MNLQKKEISRVTHKGRWEIDKEANLYIDCYVTNDARRLLSLKGAGRALELKGAGSTALARNLKTDWIQPYLTEDLKKWIEKIENGQPEKIEGVSRSKYITPLDAELFVDICKAYINAQKDGLFTDKNGKIVNRWTRQYYIADKLFKIMSAFAKIGIIALIDEVTGYQEVRDRLALQEILDKYLRKEFAKWAKRFPDEFYIEMFKLKGWQWRGMSINRPMLVGRYTDDIVYQRLAPGVRDKLREINPKNDTGKRKQKHHQWLTEDIGVPALSHHLSAVMALMRAAPNWELFKRMLVRAFPKPGDQLELDINKES